MDLQSRRKFLQTGGTLLAAGMPGKAADAARRPNILFLFPDQHRYDWTGANRGLPIHTPNLDRLSQRGVRFTKAVVASPLCAPSRACLASGKEYDRTFLQDVITHRQESVKMVDAYVPKAKNTTLRQMAEQMRENQTKEIEQLKGQLSKLGS